MQPLLGGGCNFYGGGGERGSFLWVEGKCNFYEGKQMQHL